MATERCKRCGADEETGCYCALAPDWPGVTKSNRITLGDDGTMDTVLVCSDCGKEFRFTYDGDVNNRVGFLRSQIETAHPDLTYHQAEDRANEELYGEFVADCIQLTEDEHNCEADDDDDL